MKSTVPTSAQRIRTDLPGRFSEVDVLNREWLRLLGFLQGIILPPYEVLIHPSSACNLRCDWCIGDFVPSLDPESNEVLEAAKWSKSRLPDVFRDLDAMDKVIGGILDYEVDAKICTDNGEVEERFRVDAVSFSGLIGEPLTHAPSVCLAVERLADADRRIGLFTNGVLMTPDVRKRLLRAAYVLVSVDAAEPETYAALKYRGRARGEELFARMLANTAALANEVAQTPASTLQVNASFILYPQNCHEVYGAAKRMKDAGVSFFRVKQDNSGAAPLDEGHRQVVLEALDRIETDLVDDSFRLIRIHRSLRQAEVVRRFGRCTITELMAAIGSDGELYPCNYHPRPGGTTYGSAVDGTFREVWEGSRRARLKKGLPAVCPATCDPFKNRANHLLDDVRSSYEAGGSEALAVSRDRLVGSWAEQSKSPLAP